MIYIGSDHAGFQLKEKIKSFLQVKGVVCEDMGNLTLDPNDDYPEFMFRVAEKVAQDPVHNRGIILGGSGQGEAMAANRVPGVRTAVFYGDPIDIVRLAREHNDANILSLGARFMDERAAYSAVELFLNLPFSKEPRHARRIKKLDKGAGLRKWLLPAMFILFLAPLPFAYMLGGLGAARYDWFTFREVALRLWGIELLLVMFLIAVRNIFRK